MAIEFNYNNAISQAELIEGIVKDMRDVANKDLQTTVDSISASWRGDAAQQFLRYCFTAQGDVKSQAAKLEKLATDIRRVAKVIKDAEDKAKREAELLAAKARASGTMSSGTGTGGGFSSSSGNAGGGSGGGGRAF